MPLNVCKNHSSTSLIEIYERMANYGNNPFWQEKSVAMIKIINEINRTFKTTQIWALTSHYRLILLSENNWQSRWNVIIDYIGNYEYNIQFAIPDYKSPWENGKISGDVKSLKKALKYVYIAMKESEGWKGNIELNDLLKSVYKE